MTLAVGAREAVKRRLQDLVGKGDRNELQVPLEAFVREALPGEEEVFLRENNGSHSSSVGSDEFFFDASDWKYVSEERQLPSESHHLADSLSGQEGEERDEYRDSGTGAIFGDCACWEVDVNCGRLWKRHLIAMTARETISVRSQPRERNDCRLVKHLTSRAREDQTARQRRFVAASRVGHP